MWSHGKIKVTDVSYHRNGVGGSPFYVVLFTEKDGKDKRKMIAVLFSEKGSCAVFDAELLAQGNITFGKNSWRGDVYEDVLRNKVKLWRKKENA